VTFPPPPVPVEPAAIGRWPGRYRLPSGGVIELTKTAGRLVAVSADPAAVLLLSFPEAAGAGLPWGEDAPARGALEALDRGDLAPLRSLLWEDVGEGYANRRLEGWKSLRGALGAFKGLTVLHRVPHELGGIRETQVFVLASFEKGRQALRLVRNAGGRYLIDTVNMPGKLVLPLAPLSPEEFAGWNFRLLSGPHLKFRPANANNPASFEIVFSSGSVVAMRR
jgi:hypothetical protein